MTVLAIDPGPVESAYAYINARTRQPLNVGKIPNDEMRSYLRTVANRVVIEMVASYGMPVGAEVFETCVWIGRFVERAPHPAEVGLVYRHDIKLHHCNSAKAKDGNIMQALIDRFAPGVPNRGKGTKASPGWFYGFKADLWQAYALAVYVADRLQAGELAS